MERFIEQEFSKDLEKQKIDKETVGKLVSHAQLVFLNKATSSKVSALIWSMMLVIVKQHHELQKSCPNRGVKMDGDGE